MKNFHDEEGIEECILIPNQKSTRIVKIEKIERAYERTCLTHFGEIFHNDSGQTKIRDNRNFWKFSKFTGL